ncbi:MAG: ATP-binding protein [Caldilineales bacterium]|nr:ATP-binding protein [Caldilineales bacterium]
MSIIPRSLFPALARALADQRVIVITGQRRVGKTTAARWLLEQTATENKLYLDLERLDQRALFGERNYDLVLSYLRNRGLDLNRPAYVALDEIQYAPNVPSVVKYLNDAAQADGLPGVKFILTGSSSFYLKNLFTESLAGRKIVFEMFPLSFGEFLTFREAPYRPRNGFADMVFDAYEYERLKGFYEEYLSFGGLPEVVLTPDAQTKTEILNDVLSSYINIDIRVLADFQKIAELQQLMRLLASRIGNKLDYTKLATIIGISRPTLVQYLEFLELTYMIWRLPAHSSSADRVAAVGRKLYFYDNGIAGVLARLSEGALFENAVFNQLRPYGELAYLSNGYEIDFILIPPGAQAPTAFEVKLHPVASDQQKLNRLAANHALPEAHLIGRHPTPAFAPFIWGGSIF